jgi:hypothetical protein
VAILAESPPLPYPQETSRQYTVTASNGTETVDSSLAFFKDGKRSDLGSANGVNQFHGGSRAQSDGETDLVGSTRATSIDIRQPLSHVPIGDGPRIPMVRRPQTTPDVRQALRVHETKRVLNELLSIQGHCGSSRMAVYADSLIRALRSMRDALPTDPYVDVVVALHDALAHENRWADYTAEQYCSAYEMLKSLVKSGAIDQRKADRAVLALEQVGFNTLPFEINWPTESEDDESTGE